ncbi:BPTI/Kunitz domain-containing protein-like [Amblyomma americanum]
MQVIFGIFGIFGKASRQCILVLGLSWVGGTVNANADTRLVRVPAVVNPSCLEPKFSGPCDGHFPRYYFNSTSKTCEQFIFGGCAPNGNNFENLEQCKDNCWVFLSHKSVDLPEAFDVPFWPLSTPQECTYPADSGPCEAYMERFFYNTLTKSYEQFVYGGCGGNANNFLTFSQCDKKCKKFRAVLPRA